MSTFRKPILFWAMWPDELSTQFERHFDVVYLQDQPMTYAVGPNHKLDQRFEALGRAGGDAPRIFFLNSWTKCDSLLGLDRVPAPKVAYLHDSHFDTESFDWDLAQAFSHVLLENQVSVDYHVRRGSRNIVTWCPLYFKGTCAEGRRYPPSSPRPLDVTFVGSTNEHIHPGRVAFLRSLERRLGNGVRLFFGPGDPRDIYPRSRIVINESWRADAADTAYGINFRVFEAMACGAMLLTDSPPNLMSVLFEQGRHFAGYRHEDVEDAAARISYYLAHDDERLRIAAAGWEEALRAHTVDARAEQLLPMLQDLAENGSSAPPMPAGHVSFHLGRALLRALLAWRQQEPACVPYLYYVERLAEAERLLLDALRYRDWAAPAISLIPLIRFALGDRQGAIAQWTELLGAPPSAPYSGLLLGALLDRMDARNRNSALRRLSDLAATHLAEEERKVLTEIACRAFHAEAA